ncbi:MAG: zinc-binding dehydrogenase [Desulfobacterota bacterium]|nr:zinc-binding dehydrogenase [Thermodesulfobacteriota bacterium]
MESRAAVLTQFNHPLELRSFPIPALKEGEVLVKVEAAGVCGSDVHMWEGRDPRTRLPIILGHEGAGEIVDLKGEKRDVHGIPLKKGDKVLWNRGVTCGHCYFCRVKRMPSLCPHRWVYGIHTTCSEPPFLTGNYAEYLLLVKETDFFKIEMEIEPATLVPASCSGATAAHALDLSGLESGDSVLVQGAGPLGIFMVAFSKSSGASPIVVIGGTEERLKMARRFGATHTLNRFQINPAERKEAILELTHGRGVDVAFEMAGEPGAVRECITLVRNGGTCVSAGFGEPHGTIELDCFHDLNRKNLRLQGIWTSDVRHTHMAIQLILNRKEEFKNLITHVYPLARANEALYAMKERQAVKVVLSP